MAAGRISFTEVEAMMVLWVLENSKPSEPRKEPEFVNAQFALAPAKARLSKLRIAAHNRMAANLGGSRNV